MQDWTSADPPKVRGVFTNENCPLNKCAAHIMITFDNLRQTCEANKEQRREAAEKKKGKCLAHNAFNSPRRKLLPR